MVSYVTSFVVFWPYFHDFIPILGVGGTLFRKATDYISTKRAHYLTLTSAAFFVLIQKTGAEVNVARCGQLRYVFCGFVPFFMILRGFIPLNSSIFFKVSGVINPLRDTLTYKLHLTLTITYVHTVYRPGRNTP